MKKVLCFVILISIFCVTGCNNKTNVNNSEKNKKSIQQKEGENMLNVIINDNNYILNLEDNETVKEFINKLPQEYVMNELNGNEKYVYLDSSLPTSSSNPKEIQAGDVMLFGDDCLVIFYKSFSTSYSYTKIGHIDNLPDLGNDNVIVKFLK